MTSPQRSAIFGPIRGINNVQSWQCRLCLWWSFRSDRPHSSTTGARLLLGAGPACYRRVGRDPRTTHEVVSNRGRRAPGLLCGQPARFRAEIAANLRRAG